MEPDKLYDKHFTFKYIYIYIYIVMFLNKKKIYHFTNRVTYYLHTYATKKKKGSISNFQKV